MKLKKIKETLNQKIVTFLFDLYYYANGVTLSA